MAGLQPAAEVMLYHGELAVTTVGIFDSGSPYTVFNPDLAQVIGIDDVTVGTLERISTLGGGRDIYLFDLEIQLPAAGGRFAGQVGFFAGHSPRNILGRAVVFGAFEVGFHESAQTIHLRPDLLPE